MAIDECRDDLYDEERESIQRSVPKRKQEFIAGRAMARIALSRLGIESQSIQVGRNREPLWPSSATGSITHDSNLCVAVAALKQEIALIGIDLTTKAALEHDIVDLVCTRDDRDRVERMGGQVNVDPYKLIFSIKESVYKCLYPVVQKVFDFQSVSISLEPNSDLALVNIIDSSLLSSLRGALEIRARFCTFDDFIFSAVWIEPADL